MLDECADVLFTAADEATSTCSYYEIIELVDSLKAYMAENFDTNPNACEYDNIFNAQTLKKHSIRSSCFPTF